jgi:hypothetical protein
VLEKWLGPQTTTKAGKHLSHTLNGCAHHTLGGCEPARTIPNRSHKLLTAANVSGAMPGRPKAHQLPISTSVCRPANSLSAHQCVAQPPCPGLPTQHLADQVYRNTTCLPLLPAAAWGQSNLQASSYCCQQKGCLQGGWHRSLLRLHLSVHHIVP